MEGLLESHFPGIGSESDVLVFNSSKHLASDPVFRAVIASVDKATRHQPGVRDVLGPYDVEAVGQIASDEHTAVAGVSVGGSIDERFAGTRAIQHEVTRVAGNRGVHVYLTGSSPIARDAGDTQQADTERAEGVGLPLAMLILLFAMGGLVAASVPLLFAIAGLLLADGVLTVLGTFSHFDSLLLAVMTMIGLGIGIDYALFIVSRFREELARPSADKDSESDRVADAVGIALATSGRTILYSGVIVAFSLASLSVVDSQFLRDIAIGATVVVASMLTTAMTLLPAALAMLGANVNRGALPERLRPADIRPADNQGRSGGWARWAQLIMRHPISTGGAAVAVLVVLVVPAFHLHYGLNVSTLEDTSTASGKGAQVIGQALTPGGVAPLQVVVIGHGPQAVHQEKAAVKWLSTELEGDSRVTGLGERQSRTGVLLLAVASVPIDSLSATALVKRIRNKLAPAVEAHGGPTVLVGGATAQIVDLSNELDAKFPLIIALILISAFLYLVVVFRSIVLPIKAVLMNLLVTGATIGLIVWVFQKGHGQHLLGFSQTGFIQIGVPQIMFALLFGLSMDYEVFLIRRIQEEWRKTGDNRLAVATGIEHTARPITAAAAIMVAVFGSFVVAHSLELKQLGFALAAAIALDATLIRLVLAPAAMRLFGDWNWWLPAGLARVLPGEDQPTGRAARGHHEALPRG